MKQPHEKMQFNLWIFAAQHTTGLSISPDLDNADLDPDEFRVYAHLCCRSFIMGQFIFVEESAEICKMSPARFLEAMARLAEKEWFFETKKGLALLPKPLMRRRG
jgi:hypothetical protein